MIVKLSTRIKADVMDRNGCIFPRNVLDRLVKKTNNEIDSQVIVPLVKDVTQEPGPRNFVGRVQRLEVDEEGYLGAVVDIYPGHEIGYGAIPKTILNTAIDADVVEDRGSPGVVQSAHLVSVAMVAAEPASKK